MGAQLWVGGEGAAEGGGQHVGVGHAAARVHNHAALQPRVQALVLVPILKIHQNLRRNCHILRFNICFRFNILAFVSPLLLSFHYCCTLSVFVSPFLLSFHWVCFPFTVFAFASLFLLSVH
jgi:hypothetical protein